MAEDSKIEWTDHTFNPWIGCTKVSAGCKHCYAENLMDTRYRKVQWGPGKPRNRTSEANWKKPLAWNRAAEKAGTRPKVFCASLADWLDPEVPPLWRADLMATIEETRHLDWLLLTKRPESWLSSIQVLRDHLITRVPYRPGTGLMLMDRWLKGTPPKNVWFGVTVEDQKNADERVPILLDISVKVRFLSCEPMLGWIDVSRWLRVRWKCSFCRGYFRDYSEKCPDCGERNGLSGSHSFNGRKSKHNGICTSQSGLAIDWAICGGESGSDRVLHIDSARYLRDQCLAAGSAFFMKQIGGLRKPFPEIPDDLMIRQFPEVV